MDALDSFFIPAPPLNPSPVNDAVAIQHACVWRDEPVPTAKDDPIQRTIELAIKYVGFGAPENETLRCCKEFNDFWFEPPLELSVIKEVVHSAYLCAQAAPHSAEPAPQPAEQPVRDETAAHVEIRPEAPKLLVDAGPAHNAPAEPQAEPVKVKTAEPPPSDATPLPAHKFMVIDRTRKGIKAALEERKKTGRAADFSWPETATFILPRDGDRRVYALPPGVHVPRVEGAWGMVCGYETLQQALVGCKETDKSNRPLASVPQHLLGRVTVPITPVASPPEPEAPPPPEPDASAAPLDAGPDAPAPSSSVASHTVAPETMADAGRRVDPVSIELTLFTKSNGPCTKRISLVEGDVVSNASACAIAKGKAQRIRVSELPGETSLRAIAGLIKDMKPNQALALGRLAEGVGENPSIVTERRRKAEQKPGAISRTQQYLGYKSGEPGLTYIDFDRKGIPRNIEERIDKTGSAWNALASAIPGLTNVGHISRASTNAGIYNAETGERYSRSGGEHHYFRVTDGSDIERALKGLHDRAWLHGLGWYMIGGAGQLLERSIVDRIVGSPERLVFEGAPMVDSPFKQDQSAREPDIVEGEILDTRTAIPPLRDAERALMESLKETARTQLRGQAAFVRMQADHALAEKISKKNSIDYDTALREVQARHEGRLLPALPLEFDDPDIGTKTVGDVLDNPERFIDETLADPLEGVEYGRCKAKILQRDDGTLFVNSFAHGGYTYELVPASGVNPADLWSDSAAPASLPTGVVPEIVEQAARDKARKLGVEAGAPTAALLTALGSLVPASNRLQMRQNDPDWKVPPITWTAIIGEPGSNKSATVDWAISWVKYVEREWHREYASAKRKFDQQVERHRDEKDTGSAEAVFRDVVVKPQYRQKIINDATTESLAPLLVENPDGLLCHVDELAGLFGGMDAYRTKGGKDRPFWLQAKEGGSFTVNRRQSDRIVVETCAVSVLGGIQPARIKAMAASLSDDGMLQRFLPVFIDRTGSGVDESPEAGVQEVLNQLATDIAASESNRQFKFSPEADAERLALEDFKMREISHPSASPTLRQWLDKLPNEFGRFALIMHFIEWYSTLESMIEPPPKLVSRATASRARRFLTEFAFTHARVFHGQGSSEADEHAKWIAEYILTRGKKEIDEREIYRAYPRLRKPDDRWGIQNAMRVLEMQGWATPTKESKGKNTAWRINPAAHDGRFAQIAEMEKARRDEAKEKIANAGKTRALERI